MEEFVKSSEQVLYMENFNTGSNSRFKAKFAQLYAAYGASMYQKNTAAM